MVIHCDQPISESKRERYAMKKVFVNILVAAVAALMIAGMTVPVTQVRAADEYEYRFHYWSFDGDGSDAAGKLDLYADLPEFTEGRHGKALDCETGDAMRSKKLSEKTTEGFTLGAWFKLSSAAEEWNIIMSKGNTADSMRDRFQIHIGHASSAQGGGELFTYSPATGAKMSNPGEGRDVVFDEWTQVTVTYDLHVLRMYVNGELYAEEEANYPLQESLGNMNTVTVGALNHDGQTFKFCGIIDDAFYANFALEEKYVKAAYDDPAELKAYADGTKNVAPEGGSSGGTETADPAGTPSDATPAPVESNGMVWFWPFDGSTFDMSHKRVDADSEGLNIGFDEGKAGKAVMVDDPLSSDVLPEDIDLTEFTVAFWVKWEENDNGGYTALFAISGKETPHHFELYYRLKENTGGLSFYGTGNGWNVENIADVEREEYVHIAAVNGNGMFKIYLNGEVVYGGDRMIPMAGLGDSEDIISIGGLNDRSLKCIGEFDEVVLADYAMSDEMIMKLYSDPAAAHEDVMRLVEANYPEDYTPPTATPEPEDTPVPTEEPTDADETDEPGETEGEIEEATATPKPAEEPTAEPKQNKKGCGGAFAGAGIIAAVAAAAVALIRKKK